MISQNTSLMACVYKCSKIKAFRPAVLQNPLSYIYFLAFQQFKFCVLLPISGNPIGFDENSHAVTHHIFLNKTHS